MSIIILIPAVICLVALFRWSLAQTVLNVYLPVFTLVPIYYYWKTAALPPVTFGEAVLLPLGWAILIKEWRNWKFTTMDVVVGVFLFTTYYADSLAERRVASIFGLFDGVCNALIPYMVGKLLIEQKGIRVAFVKRFLFLLFVCCLVSSYEYKMGQNPFSRVYRGLFPDETFAWNTQVRWGFGRVSGAFGQSELAGMIFLCGFVLALWMGYNQLWEPRFGRPQWLRWKKSAIISWTLGLTLLMTQARGPWLGCLVAVPVAFIGHARNIVRRALLVTVLLTVGGGLTYVALKHYVSSAPTSDEQQTAQYRQQLLDNYIPVAEQGGAWGWGVDFPRVGGQGSIDNEYLFVALVQGWVGLLTFSLIALETLVRMAASALVTPEIEDRTFAFSLLGIYLGMLVTLVTVFLGLQPYQLFFLLAGWSQVLPMRPVRSPQPVFEHVLT
jgi:hypothetical protein